MKRQAAWTQAYPLRGPWEKGHVPKESRLRSAPSVWPGPGLHAPRLRAGLVGGGGLGPVCPAALPSQALKEEGRPVFRLYLSESIGGGVSLMGPVHTAPAPLPGWPRPWSRCTRRAGRLVRGCGLGSPAAWCPSCGSLPHRWSHPGSLEAAGVRHYVGWGPSPALGPFPLCRGWP